MESNDLFHLVHSLSGAEKRFFKLHARLHGGEKNSIKLFDLLCGMKEHEPAALKRLLKKEKFGSYFSRAKNQLYADILKSMNAYRHNRSAELQLKERISGIRFLYEKGLYAQSLRQAAMAHKAALKNGYQLALLEVIHWQKKILKKQLLKHWDPEQLYKEEQDLLGMIAGTNHCWSTSEQIARQRRSKGRLREDDKAKALKQLLDAASRRWEKETLSWEGRYYLLKSHCRYYDQKGDWENAIAYLSQVLAHFASEPRMATEFMEDYIENFYTCLNIHMFHRRFDRSFNDTLERFRSLPASYFTDHAIPVQVKIKYYSILYFTEMNLCMTKSEFSQAYGLIPEIDRHFNKYPGHIVREERLITYINFSIVCFALGRHQEALAWVNRILNEPSPDLRSDVYSFARVFELILHYELEHFDLIEYQARSAYRFLHKKNLFYKLERRIYDFIRKAIAAGNEKDVRTELLKLKLSLEEMAKSPTEKAVFSNFDFLAWVKSRLEGRPFAHITS